MRESRRLIKATDELLEELSVWRKAHRPHTPLPPELWDQAVNLATRQGLWKTARALRLDYNALKKRADARTSEPVTPDLPQFIEILSPLSGQIAECILEIVSTRGAQMRIEMKNVASSGLASIIREFVDL